MKLAFEASYLSAVAVARYVKQIVTLRQSPSESVTSYVNHRHSFNNLNRQVERQHVPPLEALPIGVFERGLLPDLFELQRMANTASLCRKPLTGHNVVPRQWRQSMAPYVLCRGQLLRAVVRELTCVEYAHLRVAVSVNARVVVPVGTKVQQQHPSCRSCLYQRPCPNPLGKLVTVHPAQ